MVISVETEVRPARSVEYIGFVWDAQAKTVSVPPDTRRREYRRGSQEFTQTRAIEDDVAACDWKSWAFCAKTVSPTMRHISSLLHVAVRRKIDWNLIEAKGETRTDLQ